MSGEIEVHQKVDMDLSGALVVLGAPTLGLVGTITSRYLVQALDMELLGGFHSERFPPSVVVTDGRPLHPVRIHALQTSCGLGLKCEKLVVVTSEILMDRNLLWPLAHRILGWCKEIKSEMIIVPDALRPSDEEESAVVRGVATTKPSRQFLDRIDVPLLDSGMLAGFSASMLAVAEHAGMDLVCLLAESAPDHPDARAAARIVGLLNRVLPDIQIESKPLLEEAEQIETLVQRMQESLREQEGPTKGQHGPSMFT